MREWRVTAAYARWAAYIALGLTVVLSPIPGMLCLMGIVAWIALRRGDKLLHEIILCGTLSLSSALAILLVASPVNPWQWVQNTIATGASATGFFGTDIPVDMGVFRLPELLDLPLWNVFSLGAFGVLGMALVRQRLWWLALIYVVALIFILMPKTLIYSYFGFMPIIMLSLLSREADVLILPERLRRLPVILVCSFAFCGVAGLFRGMLLAVLFIHDGGSFEQTRAALRQLESTLNNNEEIGYNWLARPSFVVFSTAEKFPVAITLNLGDGKKDPYLGPYETRFHRKVRYVVLSQLGHVAEPPPTLNEGMFVLEINDWSKRRARIFGLKLGGAMPGYQFALYSRKEDATQPVALLDVR